MNVPIRILQFPGSMMLGGVGSVVMNLYRNIDRTKVQFDFCVHRNERGPLDDEIESLGGRIFYIPQMREYGFKHYIRSIRNIIRKNGPYKYGHIHSIHMGAVTAFALKREGVKVIYHAHNTHDPALDRYPLHNLLECFLKSYIQKNANYRFACGKKAGEYIYGSKSFEVINNAVDLSVFYPFESEKILLIRHKLGIKDNDIIVGDIARFTSVKNIGFFIKLAIADKRRKNNIRFLIVGDGEEKRNIENQITEYHLEDKFILTGSRTDVADLYNSMNIFCLPSLFEGLPVSLMEAQAVGLPCVISDTITREGVVGAASVVSLSLSANVDNWLSKLYELRDTRVFDSKLLFRIFSEKKYESKAIAEQIEKLYLK